MWTQLLSWLFALVGIGLFVHWAVARFRMRAVTIDQLADGLSARLGSPFLVEHIEAPSLNGSVNFLLQSVDRYLLVRLPKRGNGEHVTLAIDVSWLGRWSAEDSVRRAYADFCVQKAEVEKYAAGATVIEREKPNLLR